MDISFQSLFWFLIITIIYFTVPSIGKPILTLTELRNKSTDFYKHGLKRLGFYLLAVMFSQFLLNVGYLVTKCGSSVDKNIGAAALFTFIPWVLIFGIMIAILIVFPGFKSAFSDVFGYYSIASAANELFASILKDTDLNSAIENEPNKDIQKELSIAAEAILKICGNKGILINQLTPDNFLDIWDKLKPLLKPGVFTDTDVQQKLLDLVVLKDNIGEAFWYTYTAILISSIVYYNLATRGCVKSIEQIKLDQETYIKQQEEEVKQQSLNNLTTYVSE